MNYALWAVGLFSAVGSVGASELPAESVTRRIAAEDVGVQTFERLVRAISTSEKIVERLNAEAEKSVLALEVDFYRAWRQSADNWPDEDAPHAEYVKLADRAVAEFESAGVFKDLATVAASPRITFPDRVPGERPKLQLAPLRRLFQVQDRLIAVAIEKKDGLAAAERIASTLGVTRHLLGGGDVEAMVGRDRLVDSVKNAMPHVIGGALNAAARERIAGALKGEFPGRASVVDRSREKLDRVLGKLWPTLAAELFISGPKAAEAWENLSEAQRADIAGLISNLTFMARPESLPLPEAKTLHAEFAEAAERVKSWRSHSAEQMRKALSQIDQSKRRVASWCSIWARVEWNHVEALLAVESLRTAIALEDFREASGAYPASLDELCPKYLAATPDDPAAEGTKLVYVKGERTVWGKPLAYVLYSRGFDGADDGGKPSRFPGLNIFSGDKGQDVVLNGL